MTDATFQHRFTRHQIFALHRVDIGHAPWLDSEASYCFKLVSDVWWSVVKNMMSKCFLNSIFATTSDLDVAYASTLIRTALSTAHYCGLQGGAEIAYDISKGRIAKLGVALGWAKGPFTAFAGV